VTLTASRGGEKNGFRKYLFKLRQRKGVAKIKDLEKETGTLIIACTAPSVPADLSEEQLRKIDALEKKLCVRVVAYKTH
jgi:hypothetical protein